MSILDDSMLIYQVAKSYYIDGNGQKEIARMMGISRPQISRMIKKAQEIGIVKIEVDLPEIVSIRVLEKELKTCLGIDTVVIVPTDNRETKDKFYVMSAKYLTDQLDGCQRIGMGWGRSLYEVSLHISYQNNSEHVVFYPLLGGSGNVNPYLQVNNITDRFAEKYHASARYLNLPVFQRSNKFSLENESILLAFQRKWKQLDAAVIGIGILGGEDQIYIDEVSYDPFLQERIADIEGDILAHLILKEGGSLQLPGYQHVACSLENLKKIPKVIGIANGVEKADIIYRVATDKYITSLITDESTAKAIIEKYAKG